MGVVAGALVFSRTRPRADHATAALLAALWLWLWLGVVCQGLYATDIDQTLGLAHAALFVVDDPANTPVVKRWPPASQTAD